MISRKRIYDVSERFTDYLMDQAAALAFPGRDARLPPVLVIALPKSGSVYLQRALRRTLRVPVHHIASGGMSGASFGHADLCRFEQGNVVSREHLQPRAFSLKVLAKHGVRKAVLHVRDPRAAIVSWTRHMDRILESRGFRSVELSCEIAVPEDYPAWSFDQRLCWQVVNKMPSFVRWIEDWLLLAESSRDVDFLITDHAELSRDGRGLVERILDFHGIAYDPKWIFMPSTRFGRNNIFSMLEAPCPAKIPAWVRLMPPEALDAADALLPDRLAKRFGWTKG
jgi:hypothetical protein